MIENFQKNEAESIEVKTNPFSFLAILLFYPALGLAIRMGFLTYYYLFNDFKGLKIILGIIITLIITIIYIIIVVFLMNFLIELGNKIWRFIITWKESRKTKIELDRQDNSIQE